MKQEVLSMNEDVQYQTADVRDIRSLSELTFMGTQSKLQSFLVTTWIVTMRIHAEFLLPFSSAFTGKPRH
jgi:hypothetical protein